MPSFMKFNVVLDVRAARASMKGLEKEVNKAAGRALNRVATTVRKEADQEIRTRLSLKSATVKAALSVDRPFGQDRLIRDVVATGKPIPLRDYSARRVSKGVTYKIGKGKPRKVYIRNQRKGFINPKFGGGNVFVATGPNPSGPKNAPIKKVYGPSITQGFQAARTQLRMRKTAIARWPIEFEREMAYRRTKAGL